MITFISMTASTSSFIYYHFNCNTVSSTVGLGIIGKVGKAAEESGVSIHAVLQVRTRTYPATILPVIDYWKGSDV